MPMKMTKYFKDQGINGPPYKLFYGNLEEIVSLMIKARSKPMELSHLTVSRLLSFEDQAIKNYGKMFVSWIGPTPRVNIMDPDMIRDILSNKFGHFSKVRRSNPLGNLLNLGLVAYDGEKWVKHRRIINPAFHQEKLKRMSPTFCECTSDLVSNLEKIVSKGPCEVDIWPHIQHLTSDIISRAAFGTTYEEGRRIFELQTEMADLTMQLARSIYIPGFRFIPTKRNRRMKEIYREVRSLVRDKIKQREKVMKVGEVTSDDLLGLLMESNMKEIKDNKLALNIDEVIEECKLFYIAGQETTSTLLVWTMISLSMHPEWQQKAREEVLHVFGNKKPDFDGLSNLKIVTMIFNEVLRLYPPVGLLTRVPCKTIKLGEVHLPPDVELGLPILLIHHDHDLWGEDADEFNPERFSEGISKATKGRLAYFPFSTGPRICVGYGFALVEAKMALAMILQNFAFELSPTYAHAPYTIITIQPQHGAQLILHKV
ncbi:Cytochrome p450 [Thalictrum thalictroides]|uniref:Cytochrome p450 n=1 Tax=Thalictrum thalictroides TaxID=46969 RepID=A0A7J6VXS9_THATH|nr:Cytochrome p450 [Thalictrum thalictroides]